VKYLRMFALFFVGTSSALAQSRATVALKLLTEGVDAYATERNATRVGFREFDPVARPFVTHGTSLLAGYFAADAGLQIGAAWWLTRHHHRTLSRIVMWSGIASSTWGAETSFRGYGR
jgi:hypothetical protein